jgi:hypothetical protein
MSVKTLSQQVSGEPVCAVLIILAILSVPRYFRLPESLELLFHDMFGQILLLLFAILVGSYSFLCGVLLVVLFITIMLQLKAPVSEGFVGTIDPDMALGKPKSVDGFEDMPTMPTMMPTMAPMAPMAPMANTTATKMTQAPTATMMPSSTPVPTTMASEATFPSNVEGYKTTIKKLEDELNECKATNLTLRTNMAGTEATKPLPTQGVNISSKTGESFEDVDDENEENDETDYELESKAKKITVMSKDDGVEEIEGGDIEEGFCGCNRSDNRVKLAKVVAQSEPSFNGNSPYENFQNPPMVPQMKSASINPYDVAGCRYDNDFEKDLHDTFYGPPLASCRAYAGSNKATGTLFYPMN